MSFEGRNGAVVAPANGASVPGTSEPEPDRGHAERVTFMDCPFDPVTFDEAVDRIVGWCHRERRPHTVMTMNAALLVMMREDPALAAACRAGDLIVPDGMPLLWASGLVGKPLAARVAGVDLMGALLERGARERLRVFFLGAKEEVVSSLVRIAQRDYPGLVVAGYRNGYFGEADHPAVIEQIRASRADMLFIGMPSPFKEVWGEKHRGALGVPVIMGVGGSFDVLTGVVRRAPQGLQRMGMEWFWRLMMEPRKMWKRYLVTNTLFIGRVARAAVKSRLP